MLRDFKNHSKSIKRFRTKSEDSWCLENKHLFFFVCFGFVCFFCFVCIGSSKDPGVQKTINVHALRYGTAAGRHDGAAREHSIFQGKLYFDLLVTYTVP